MEYAYNFMEYLNQRRNLPFEVQAFTSPQILCEYAKTQPIEILLISDKAMCEEVRRLKVGKLIILTEGVHNPELDQYPSVYKYQASDSVVREVMECYGAEKAARESLPQWKRQASRYRYLQSGGALPENIFCADAGADSGEGQGGAVSESGELFGL